MSLEKYRALVDRLESYAQQSPTGYRLKLAGLAALGYGYIFALLAILVGTLALLVAAIIFGSVLFIKVAIPVAIFAWAVVRALWVRVEPPEGRGLGRAEAPELFAVLDDVRRQMGAPKIHQVLVTPDFNAAVTQVPRLGILGWQKNHLMIGLPLMMTLSPDEFRAVVAHELGHLAGNHSKFATWIYRVRMSWFRLKAQFEASGRSSFLINRFFNWFVPYFGAYSFVLARINEFEADRASAQVAGAQAAGRALARVHVAGSYLSETFWPSVARRNDQQPQPPRALFVDMGTQLRDSVADADAEVHLARQLERPGGLDDTHPSLARRLESLGVEAQVPAPPVETAADAFMGELRSRLLDEFNQQWFAGARQPWQRQYEQAQMGVARLEDLEDRLLQAPQADPTLDAETLADGGAPVGALEPVDDADEGELLELAHLIERFRQPVEAAHLYWTILERDAAHPGANFAVGRILLNQDDPDGIEYIRRAIDADERYSVDGGYMVAGFFLEREDYADAQPWIDKAEVYEQKIHEARLERDQVLPDDVFFHHGLSDEQVEALVAQLSTLPDLEKAYLVCKEVEHFPEDPIWVLGIEAGGFFSPSSTGRQAVAQIAEFVRFPHETLIFDVGSSEGRWIRKKLSRVPGSRIL